MCLFRSGTVGRSKETTIAKTKNIDSRVGPARGARARGGAAPGGGAADPSALPALPAGYLFAIYKYPGSEPLPARIARPVVDERLNGRFAVLVEPAGSAAPLSSAGLHNPLGRLVAAAYAPILIIILRGV